MKKEHSELWKDWRIDFVNLWNKGNSYKEIMEKYSLPKNQLVFSWTVIEAEIRKAIENNEARLETVNKKAIRQWTPDDFKLERTTVWDFQKRGTWAVHNGNYRGNFAPQLPRNLIIKYTNAKDKILDPFVGSGTSLIESWITNRKSVGIDISPFAIQFTNERLAELEEASKLTLESPLLEEFKPTVIQGNARQSRELLSRFGFDGAQFDLICVHPPYWNSMKYTQSIEGDLSRLKKVQDFYSEMFIVAEQLYSVLKEKGICALLIGDVRKEKRMIDVGFEVMNRFKQAGFKIKDIIVKIQHQDKSTEFFYNKASIDYLIKHEYLVIFDK